MARARGPASSYDQDLGREASRAEQALACREDRREGAAGQGNGTLPSPFGRPDTAGPNRTRKILIGRGGTSAASASGRLTSVSHLSRGLAERASSTRRGDFMPPPPGLPHSGRVARGGTGPGARASRARGDGPRTSWHERSRSRFSGACIAQLAKPAQRLARVVGFARKVTGCPVGRKFPPMVG